MKHLLLATVLLAALQLQAQNLYKNITVHQADSLIKARADHPDFVILDVRTPLEYSNGHLENSVMINYLSRKDRKKLWKLDKNKSYLIYCRSGGRSLKAMKEAEKHEFREVYNMLGGMRDWYKEGYPIVVEAE